MCTRKNIVLFFAVTMLYWNTWLPTALAAQTSILFTGFAAINSISVAPFGTNQSALKTGDPVIFRALVHSPFGTPPVVRADLSELGVFGSTTVPIEPGSPDFNSNSLYDFGPFNIGPDVTDGLKTVSTTVTDFVGDISTSTAQVVVDNVPPTISLSSITFSTTSPKQGDYIFLSGKVDGTGSAARVYGLVEGIFDENGVPMPGSFRDMRVTYDTRPLNEALATSIDGTFTNFPVQLFEGFAPGDIGQIMRSTSFRITISAYDEAGNTGETSLTVPVPRPSATDACIAPGNCASNVLFLPGIEASRLYRPDTQGGDKKLWEPGLHDTLQDLYLTPDGKSVRTDIYTRAGDVVDETPVTGANIYKSFIAKMNSLVVAGTINNWEAAPYDWRLSLDDILARGGQTSSNISYLEATDTPYIIQELKKLAATSKTGKVTIVAHSSGGLVAKELTEVLGPEAPNLIDKMIFVAVPQAGTPEAVAALMHGHGQDFGGGQLVSLSNARTFASTSPMTYNLVPSASYFTRVDDPVVAFDSKLPDWIARYGATIHSTDSLHAFLTDSFGRVDSQTGDTNQPIEADDALLLNAEALHASLDNWTPPPGVQLIQIAGWGIPTTLSGITYKKNSGGMHWEPNLTVDGDGVVVVPSALWTSTTTGAVNYWVDLKSYNTLLNRILGFRFKADHSSILEVSGLLTLITDNFLTNNMVSLPQFISTSTPPTDPRDKRLRFVLHSPLTLNLYDDQGRHTGISATTGEVEEQIPGSYYAEFGDVKYLFSDASTTGTHVVMNGYAPGTFTLNIDELSGDTVTASTTFQDVPTTASTTATFSVPSDILTPPPMTIDSDSDGVIDRSYVPGPDGAVALDTTPPELRLSFSTSTNSIEFTGSDDMGTTTISATTTVTVRDASGNTVSLVYTEDIPSPRGRDIITPRALVYNGTSTPLSSTSLSYKWRMDLDSLYTLFASLIRTASSSLESHFRPNSNETIFMAEPQDLDDFDEEDSTNTRPVQQTVPNMVLPYLMTEKGRVITGY